MRTEVLDNRTHFSAVVAVAAAVLLGQPDVVAQQDWYFPVDDPRPLAYAARAIGALCECIVTYEDPQWTREQVVDVTALRPDGRLDQQVFSPAGQPFAVWYVMPPSDKASTQFSESLRAVLEHSSRSGNPGVFGVRQHGNVYHITPASGSVLDVQVSLPATAGPEGELVGALLRAVTAARQTAIVMGDTNLGLWPVEMTATNETAESVLTRLLTTRGYRRSWQLLYDFGSQKYMLNIHAIN